MNAKLSQLQTRIEELKRLAAETLLLANRLSLGEKIQPELSLKGQQWYRGAREILVQAHSSALEEFDECYGSSKKAGHSGHRTFTDIESYIGYGTNSYHVWPSTEQQGKEYFGLFTQLFTKAETLLVSVVDEMQSRDLPVKSQLSFEVAANEFATAQEIISNANGEELFFRIAGVVTRIALERHLFTVAEQHAVTIVVNPPNKKKAEAQDVIISLKNAGLITPIQQSKLETLFKVGNNCAHPKEVIIPTDIIDMVKSAQDIAVLIM